jgi:NAD(P)-dependent dehydrogenase (short-subunit alcohol dehydrogenase family)
MRVDVSKAAQVEALGAATLARFGAPHLVFNNAGVGWAYGEANPGSMGKLHETTTEWWQTVMAINLDSYFYATREALGHMMAAGSGSIVNVASMGGVTGLYDGHTYTAAKGAIVNLTRSLAITYIKDGIRSNAVCPGFVDTPMIESVVPAFADPAVGNALTPIGRPAAPGEIASANLFFASDDSSYCNGAILVVDGGCTSRSFAG